MKILVYGIVQGIGFRPMVVRIAKKLGLRGYVMNKGSHVEIFVNKNDEKFLEEIRKNLPEGGTIEKIEIRDEKPSRNYHDFEIVKSEKDVISSLIPPDTAICEDCLREMFDPKNRRYMYPFTNCTVCGARFSIIISLPYDRENTTMKDFPMCPNCRREYENIEDRRYDAQTISCPTCGPHYTLHNKHGEIIYVENPIKVFAKKIEEGNIGVAKSWGGMHLIVRMDMVDEFRRWYGRKEKPFAVMFRDIDTLKKYAYIRPQEEKFLKSKERPIVLLRKKETLPEGIAPGLPTVGAYLPYSGFHHLFFHFSSLDGVIMTSANPRGLPMLIRNEEIFSLGADYYLLHNRKIENRVDDSVLRVIDENPLLIRRSRGFVPLPINAGHRKKIIALGAQMNVSGSISVNGKIYGTQYIGNIENYETLKFLEGAIRKYMDLFDVRDIDAIVIDKNPRYSSRILAKKFSEEFNSHIIEVQHHYAHASSLLLDSGMDEMTVLALDGTGYGDDGQSWGGEIIESSFTDYRRIGHLEYIPLLGGDRAVIEPERIVFAVAKLLGRDYKIKNAEILEKMMERSVKTSSFGRVLDALSSYLGICKYRYYDGEPAMKLETYLMKGRKRYDLEVEIKGDTIRTLPLFERMFDTPITNERDKADLAYSFVYGILRAMVDMAYSNSERIGLTGGVSYDEPIVRILREITDKRIVLHKKIPPGDNGVSFGQNMVGAHYDDNL